MENTAVDPTTITADGTSTISCACKPAVVEERRQRRDHATPENKIALSNTGKSVVLFLQ
jgi:hypothetical protein